MLQEQRWLLLQNSGQIYTSSPPSQLSMLGCWVAPCRAGPGEKAFELRVGSRAGQGVNPGPGSARGGPDGSGRHVEAGGCEERRSELKIPCPFAFLCCVIDCARQLGSAPSQPPSITAPQHHGCSVSSCTTRGCLISPSSPGPACRQTLINIKGFPSGWLQKDQKVFCKPIFR